MCIRDRYIGTVSDSTCRSWCSCRSGRGAQDDTCTQAQSVTQHATIYPQEDGSFIIPAELLSTVELGGIMELDVSHEFGNFMHFINDTAAGDRESVGTELQPERDVEELEASEISYGAAATEDVSDTENYSEVEADTCLLYTSPSPRDGLLSRMPSSA